MSTVAKILIVVNLVLAGAFLASASSFLGAEDQWRHEHDQVKVRLEGERDKETEKLEQERSANATLTSRLTETSSLLSQAREQATQFRTQSEVLATELAQTSAQLGAATNALNAAQATIRHVNDLLTAVQSERNTLADTARNAQEQRDAAMRQVNDLQIQNEGLLETKQQLESSITSLENKVRGLELTVSTIGRRFPEAAGDLALEQPALPPGQVLDADNQAGIAIISYGKEDGIRAGHRFVVFRGSDYVSTLVITDTEARQSAGRIVKDLAKAPIQRGDRVMGR
jgi:archaellum component FlaC